MAPRELRVRAHLHAVNDRHRHADLLVRVGGERHDIMELLRQLLELSLAGRDLPEHDIPVNALEAREPQPALLHDHLLQVGPQELLVRLPQGHIEILQVFGQRAMQEDSACGTSWISHIREKHRVRPLLLIIPAIHLPRSRHARGDNRKDKDDARIEVVNLGLEPHTRQGRSRDNPIVHGGARAHVQPRERRDLLHLLSARRRLEQGRRRMVKR
mmetsp:Transcript_18612/g.53811  ORF Transcript_18612/g.53811 Transcript_18612/m.53811 type:complete len:214 (-) Transcript_18612:179-820(-)